MKPLSFCVPAPVRPAYVGQTRLYASIVCLAASLGGTSVNAQTATTQNAKDAAQHEEVAELSSITVNSAPRNAEGPVRGYVAEQTKVGTKTRTSILEVPQSVSVVTRSQMDLQQSATTSQSLRYTTDATSEKFGAFGSQLDFTRIRGIDADYYLNGLRIIGNAGSWAPQIDPFTLERVEVLRGPSAVLYGQGTGGGIINQVSRMPEAEASHELSLRLGNYGHKFIGIDSTGALNDSQTLLYRLTATGLNTNSQVEDTRHKRIYLAPSITWRPSAQTSWTILATHSYEPDIPNYNSLPAALLGLNDSPYAEIDRNRNYQDMAFEDSTRKQNSLSSIFEHDFGDGWGFTSNMRYMRIDSDLQRTAVYGYQVVNGQPFLKDTYELSPSSVRSFSMDNYVHGTVSLGATEHQLLAGVDYSKGTVKNALYSDGPYLVDPYGSHYRPDRVPNFDASKNAPWAVKQKFDRLGFYLQDQIAYDHWRLTAGVRHDQSKTNDWTQSYSPNTTHTKMDDGKWTWRVGLSYQFDNGIAPYASHSTSFDPILGSGYDGKAFVPVESKQTEVGIKFHPNNSSTLFTAAVFNLEQTNVKTADSNHLGFNTQAGKVRTRGIDLSLTTELARNLNLIAGYTYLDNTLVQDAAFQGNSLTQTPKHSASLWVDYLISQGALNGLKVGGGIRYLGSTWGDPANTFKVPSTTLMDMVLNYDLWRLSPALDGMSVSLNVNNLTNKKYVASCTSAMYCFLGQDRTIMATLNYRW
ncbi:MAG: TonB-dependent siderophore receptor [Paenalcaligenes sp.]